MLRINSNGSHFAGSGPSPIEDLYEVLASYALDRTFEMYGNFSMREEGEPVRFWGNFANLSHVFSIDTDEPEVIERLTSLIEANRLRPDYISQPDPFEQKRIEDMRSNVWIVARALHLDRIDHVHARAVKTSSGSIPLYEMDEAQMSAFLAEGGTK